MIHFVLHSSPWPWVAGSRSAQSRATGESSRVADEWRDLIVDQSTDFAAPDEPISVEAAHSIPLEDLPMWIRITAEQKAAVANEWNAAFGNFRERRRSLALYFHGEEKLGITAAEMKADIDPHVIEAGEYSRRLKERIGAFENAERQLQQELAVKLALAHASGAGQLTKLNP
jgi:hypothetical protein